MKKTFKEFVGTPIREKTHKGLLGRVTDLSVNPDNGEIVALFLDLRATKLIPTNEVLRVAGGSVWVESVEALADRDEIIRIREVIERELPIYGNKVFTVSRQYLGTVLDVEFETNGWIITQLFVAKKILGIPTERKLIDTDLIVQIKPNEITVQDATVKAASGKAVAIQDFSAQPAADLVKSFHRSDPRRRD